MSFVVPSSDQSGYFRIGPIVLPIPPEGIRFVRETNNDEILPLRSKFSQEIKTGQTRWNATIRWKSFLTPDATGNTDYSQWEDIRTLVAMVKAAPFVDVENDDIRRILAAQESSMSYSRLAFALKQLVVTSSTDIVDAVECILNMTLFNYLPYSKDFSFRGADGDLAADGNSSPAFQAYLDSWKAENLDHPYSQTNDDDTSPEFWRDQNPDGFSLSWRRYYTHTGAPSSVSQTEPVEDGTLLKDLPVDHFNSNGTQDGVTFRYQLNTVDITGGRFESNEHNLYVNEISVAFTNNLATIPLADFQYPTFQHIGPAGTLVSLAFQQKGYESSGLPSISKMLSALENQYLQFRNQWRRTASIHKMQAIFIQNQLLNMLGIFGMMDTQFTFQNSEESADIVEAQLVARQYENIFDSLTPYRVKGPMSDYTTQFNQVFSSQTYKGLSDADKNTIQPVVQFQAARDSLDQIWLNNYLKANEGGPTRSLKTFVTGSSSDILSSLANTVTLPAVPTKSESDLLSRMANAASKTIPYFQTPARTGRFAYSDFFYLTRNADSFGLSDADRSAAEAMHIRIESQNLSATDNAVANLYTVIFNLRSNPLRDPIFAAALNAMLENPTLRAKLLDTTEDELNSDHGAYRDIGIRGSVVTPGNVHPASYFTDYSELAMTKASAILTSLIQGDPASGTDGLFSAYKQVNAVGSDSSAVQVYPSELGIAEGNPFGILARTSFPNYSMKAAYPTFKIFFMEEDNLNVYHMLDDFYSYSSVVDFEVERHMTRGHTAIIHLTNLAGLLNHKLFDGSVLGKQDRKFYKWIPDTATTPGGDTVTGNAGVITATEGRSFFGLGNFQEGVSDTGRPELVPLRYFPLQSGTKIQIRVGNDNDPDKLTPIFQGVVATISGTEILEIIAQGFQAELVKPPSDGLKSDGWSPISLVGNMWNSGKSFVTDLMTGQPVDSYHDFVKFLSFQKGPAFGGWRMWGDGGDTGTVMAKMLEASSAKHFGNWQVAQVNDQYLKGFTWEAAIGSWMDAASTTGSLLKTAYNRRDENIMIDHMVNIDGSFNPGRLKRSYSFESPTQFALASPPQYFLPNDGSITPWQVMSDVARRYPEYNLLVKNYGFPYGADATLVFGHPLDWYYSRMPYFGENLEKDKVQGIDASYFAQWWNGGGKARFISLYDQYIKTLFGASGATVAATVTASNIDDLVTGYINDLEHSLSTKFSNVTGLGEGSVAKEKAALLQLLDDMRRTIAHLKSPTTSLAIKSSDRIKPIRRFHYADYRNIIHNGITVNDSFNNTVKLAGDMHCLSGATPPQHQRVVDVDDRVISLEKNVPPHTSIHMCYAQSFLREECAKMYGGEIILTQMEKIEEGDVLLINDHSTGISGPVEVESVLHSFDQQSGSITIVRPRAWLLVNEAASADTLAALRQTLPALGGLAHDAGTSFQGMSGVAQESAKYIGGATATAGTGLLVGAAANGTLAAAAGILSGPVGWVAGGIALVVGAGITSRVASKNTSLNLMLLVPLSRSGHPWVGGLEGYRLTDIASFAGERWNQWVTEEIAPTIEGFRLLRTAVDPFTTGTQPSSVQDLAPATNSNLLSRLRNLPANIVSYIADAATKYQIPIKLLQALVAQESGGKLNAVNPKTGASGIMQLMPETAAGLGVNLNDPRSQIDGGAKLLSGYYRQYKSWSLALAAYNAGPVAVSGGGKRNGVYIPKHAPSIPNYPETQNYVASILASAGLPTG